jgi:hypothetical protein
MTDARARLRARYDYLVAELRRRGLTEFPPFPTEDLNEAANLNRELVAWLTGNPHPMRVRVLPEVYQVPKSPPPGSVLSRRVKR